MQKRTRRILILGTIFLLLVGAWWGWSALTAPEFLTPRVERALSEALETRCQVEGLEVSFFSGVSVDSVTIHPPEQQGKQNRPLVLRGIHLTHDLKDLILHSYRLESIEVQQVSASIGESTLDWPLVKSLRDGLSRAGKGEPEVEPPPLPRITLHRGTIRVAVPGLDAPLTIEGLALNVSEHPETGLLGSGHCQIAGTQLWMEVRRAAPDDRLRIEFTIPSLNAGAFPLPRHPKARKFLAHFETAGRVRGNLSFPPSRSSDSGRQITGSISVEGLNARHTQWGLAATNINGKITVSKRSMQAIGFSGLLNGAPFTIDTAGISFKGNKPHHAHLAGQVRHLDLAALPVQTLPHDLKKPLTETGVTGGIGDVEFRIEMRPEGKPVRRVKITTYQAEMKPREVPLPIKNVDMVALWREKGRLDIPRATATVHGGRVRIRGYFLDEDKDPRWGNDEDEDESDEDDDDDAIPHLTVEFEDVPATQELLEKMPEPEPAEIGRKLGLTDAVADGMVRIDGKDVKLRLLARAARMCSPEFPYPVESVAAEVEWSAERKKVHVHEFTARHGGGALRGSAVADLHGEPVLNMEMQASRLPVDDDLKTVMDDDLKRKWDTWNPEGHFDLSLSLRDRSLKESKDNLEGVEAELRLREVNLNREDLGRVAHDLTGTVYLGREGFRLEDVTGIALGVPFHANGPIATSLEESQLVFNSERIPITVDLVENWPDPVAAPLRKLKPAGKFRMHAENVRLTDGGNAIAGKLTLTLDEVDLEIGSTPVHTSGTARMELQRAGGGLLSTSGTLHLDDLKVAGLHGKNLDANVKFQNSRLTVPSASIQTYGGTASAHDFTMESDGSEWELDAKLTQVEMESLVEALGMGDPPTGVLRLSMHLKGNSFDSARMQAHGKIKCERGDLYTFPFILSVLRILDLRLPGEAPATNALGNFELKKGVLHLNDMLLTGGTMPVHVQGTVGIFKPGPWGDQPVDMLFTLIKPDGLLDSIPIISIVKKATVDQLREQILQARVHGTVDNYETQTVMDPLTAPVRALWGMLERISP